MKDLTQEFLKLHVIATAIEILDKVLPARGLLARPASPAAEAACCRSPAPSWWTAWRR